MDKRQRKIGKFFQVTHPIKGLWHGTDRETNITRLIEINTNDILVKSNNGKYYHKLNKNGAINIKLPSVFIVERGSINFNNYFYENGFNCNIKYDTENSQKH